MSNDEQEIQWERPPEGRSWLIGPPEGKERLLKFRGSQTLDEARTMFSYWLGRADAVPNSALATGLARHFAAEVAALEHLSTIDSGGVEDLHAGKGEVAR